MDQGDPHPANTRERVIGLGVVVDRLAADLRESRHERGAQHQQVIALLKEQDLRLHKLERDFAVNQRGLLILLGLLVAGLAGQPAVAQLIRALTG